MENNNLAGECPQKGRIFNNLSFCLDKEGIEMYAKQVKIGEEVKLVTKCGVYNGVRINNPDEMLSLEEKRKIFDEFYPVAVMAFGQNKSRDFERDVFDHLFKVKILILAFNDGIKYKNGGIERGVAFATYTDFSVDGRLVVYNEGTAVDPLFQGEGFYQAFNRCIVDEFEYFTARTQNPVIITAMSKIGEVVPVQRAPNELELKILERLAVKTNMPDYDFNQHLCRNFYGGRLNAIKPRIGNKISMKMNEKLNIDNGDCILALSKINKIKDYTW